MCYRSPVLKLARGKASAVAMCRKFATCTNVLSAVPAHEIKASAAIGTHPGNKARDFVLKHSDVCGVCVWGGGH
jgi:hypothetical protein